MVKTRKRLLWFGVALILLGATSTLLWKTFFYKEKAYFAILPVKITRANLPCVDVMVEGKTYPVVIDLGSRFGLYVNTGVLKNFNKKRCGIEKWRNLRGKGFKYPKYTLSKLEMGSLIFQKPVVVSTPEKEGSVCVIWQGENEEKLPSENIGHIGRELLKNVNLLFDIKRSVTIATNDWDVLKSEGYEMDSFIKVPFSLKRNGMIVRVETDLGQLKLILDTGSTLTLLKDSMLPKDKEVSIGYHGLSSMNSGRFVVGGVDFGSQELTFLKMTDKLRDIDGLLGMDFIQNHVIYVDFSKKILYIQPPKE
ncbi:hypothetical protein [Candidatus Neptunochlamydia vexilliferae]|uniref:hypothetical protein n=1 Tax=Candidatus Neptunichlamydia vexilliferae TaxID=1651774 RepID=UPI0018914E6C|nr:hypothetical protein [Candidatus Neptunochlamydia vexilliferae]